MDHNQYSGTPSGFQYGKQYNQKRNNTRNRQNIDNTRKNDEDLIIEDNTIYEIDRECYERLKKMKNREK